MTTVLESRAYFAASCRFNSDNDTVRDTCIGHVGTLIWIHANTNGWVIRDLCSKILTKDAKQNANTAMNLWWTMNAKLLYKCSPNLKQSCVLVKMTLACNVCYIGEGCTRTWYGVINHRCFRKHDVLSRRGCFGKERWLKETKTRDVE